MAEIKLTRVGQTGIADPITGHTLVAITINYDDLTTLLDGKPVTSLVTDGMPIVITISLVQTEKPLS